MKEKQTVADTPALAVMLAEGLVAMGLAISAPRRQLLLDYMYLLDKWNHIYNLTAVRDLEQMVTRHLLDSLSLSPLVVGERLIDVGSGAGLPGLVLAIAHPQRRFVLLDSALKRTRFLIQAVQELRLTNVRIERARVEDFKPGRPFDCMVSRAALGLTELIAAADALLVNNGLLLSMQGRRPENSSAYTRCGVVFKRLQVPGLDAHRHVAIYHCG